MFPGKSTKKDIKRKIDSMKTERSEKQKEKKVERFLVGEKEIRWWCHKNKKGKEMMEIWVMW